MKIVHISDTHGSKQHAKIQIPECDVLVFTGDMGGRTNPYELTEFLVWFEKQPARKKIMIAGNHDIVLDKKFIDRKANEVDVVAALILRQQHLDALRLLEVYDVTYLNRRDYVFEGVKFYGSPYSPSFHKEHWAFNADRGEEIKKEWAKIPSDVNVLLTHTPPYGILDDIRERKQENEMDVHVGCKDLLEVIKKRLLKLQVHCFGHIHDNYGVSMMPVSRNRRVMFSNGAILSNDYTIIAPKPIIINI